MEWIKNPFASNHISDWRYVERMVLSLPNLLEEAHGVLNTTLAFPQSRFLDLRYDSIPEEEAQFLRLWAVRLIYLSIHYNQHRHALPEAQAMNKNCRSLRTQYNISVYDFECPDAQYLIMENTRSGVGANSDFVLEPTLLAALATGRVALFSSFTRFRRPQKKESVCPRRDFQCFFAPPSPCLPTKQQMGDAYTLTADEKRELYVTGQIPETHRDTKVILISNKHKLPGVKLGDRLPTVVRETTELLLSGIPNDDPRRLVMNKALLELDRIDEPRVSLSVSIHTEKFRHAAMFYALRPNLFNRARLDAILADSLPANYDPERLVGLPIRATDKCLRESECLTLDQHVRATDKMWKKLDRSLDDSTIVLTTESREMMTDMQAYAEQKPGLTVLTNSHDKDRDSGGGTSIRKVIESDILMLSAISSLQLQLATRATIGNCCSNFHVMMLTFLSEGLGAAKEHHFHCLQEEDDPEFLVCCWKGPRCTAIKLEMQHNATLGT